MSESYPKFQYSVFLKNGRDQQIVIRTETFDELLEAKRQVNTILEKVESETQTTAKTKPCECGGTKNFREGISKTTGKKWSGWFCSNPECKPEFVNYASKI